MTAELGIALLKVLLGLAVFIGLGYLGRFYDKRIAGVLLTFPILNGIGILAGQEPLAVAESIYAVVVFNGLLLFLMISFCCLLPPMPSATATTRLVVRLIVWTATWTAGAPLIILFRDRLPGAIGLLLIQCVIAAAAARWVWQAAPDVDRRSAPSSRPSGHLRALVALWSNPAGLLRIGLFVACCVLLLIAAHFYPSKWVGMVSALPLPGLFAVATLSLMEEQNDFDLLRDSVLFGPPTVIVFNWLYAQIVVRLPDAMAMRTTLGILALLVLLAIDALLIFWIVPKISAYLDRVRKQETR